MAPAVTGSVESKGHDKSRPSGRLRLVYRGAPVHRRRRIVRAQHFTDDSVDPMASDLEAALNAAGDDLDLEDLSQALYGGGDTEGLLDLASLSTALAQALKPAVEKLMLLGISQEASTLFATFGTPNASAVDAAGQYTAWLVQGITDSTRQAIQSILRRAFDSGIAPRGQASLIADALRAQQAAQAGSLVAGLTEKQANAVYNYLASQLAAGADDARAWKLAQDYADRLLKQRALNIARTETIRASALGQQALWNASASMGYINPATARKTWSAAPGARTCSICGEELDGQAVRLNESFTSSLGALATPPAHTCCRCSMILTFDKTGQQPGSTDAHTFAAGVTSALYALVGKL